jgi:hypothetical protein
LPIKFRDDINALRALAVAAVVLDDQHIRATFIKTARFQFLDEAAGIGARLSAAAEARVNSPILTLATSLFARPSRFRNAGLFVAAIPRFFALKGQYLDRLA